MSNQTAAPTSTPTPENRAKTDWVDVARRLGSRFEARAAEHDRSGRFVAENYDELREASVFSAAIATELGGGGASYAETCDLLRELARHCPSTALSVSMHTHLVAASVFKLLRGAPEEGLQKRIASEQLVLVSTGATDWVDSNGTLTRVEGGYRFSARKVFASGSPAAAVLVTSGRFEDPDEGPVVLHFPVPFSADGVSIDEDWDTIGMRGTGSHSVCLEEVFVPDESIALRRPRGEWHPVWNIVLTVALPIILSVYRGIAEKARDLAIESAERKTAPHLEGVIGEMENSLAATQLAVDDMIRRVDEYRFEPTLELANAMLVRKTLAAESAARCVERAVEVAGGVGFYRRLDGLGLEQLFRDIQAAAYHPLPRAKQLGFTARVALGRSPIA